MYSQTHATALLVCVWVMPGVAFIFMSLRFICIWRYRKSFGWDDYILAFAWLLDLLYGAFITLSVKRGLGAHMAEIPRGNIYWLNCWLDQALTCTIFSISLSKTSFALTLLRFAPRTWQRFLIWFFIVSGNIMMTLVVILQYCQCNPIKARWDPAIPGTCFNPRAVIYFGMVAGSYSALWDFLLATLPWFIIWKIQMNKREKFGVCLAMSMGVLAGVTGVMKTVYLPLIGHWEDFSYKGYYLLVWTGAESSTTIVAASIPFLRVLVKNVASTPGKDAMGTGTVATFDQQAEKRPTDDGGDSGRRILGEDLTVNNSNASGSTQNSDLSVQQHERMDLESQTIRAPPPVP